MLDRPITLLVLTAALVCASPADKPSPFPGERPRQQESMSGAATFFRLKDDSPAADSLTAAHVSLPIGSRVKVVNAGNGKSVIVRVTDRFAGGNGLVISVSRPAAEQLGFVREGTAQVKLELVPSESR
jgi:hypothetical protein